MNTKDQVLYALEQHRGTPLSGSRLAAELGLSRTAIWKAINALREEGYVIDSKTRSGYLLSRDSDILSSEGVRACLRHDISLHLYESLESTNKTAAALAMDDAPHGTTVIAREQTAGRGRRGREFYSPKDTGLYLSIILTPPRNHAHTTLVTTAVAVAVSRAIDEISKKQSRIKWVNDIYLDDHKISGILTEAITDMESGQIGTVITGIGINCTTDDFPPDAGELAGSIGGRILRNQLAALVIDNVLDITMELDNGPQKKEPAFLADYRNRSMVLGHEIEVYETIGGTPYSAVAEDIDVAGGLIIRLPDGDRHTLSTGEITIRLR